MRNIMPWVHQYLTTGVAIGIYAGILVTIISNVLTYLLTKERRELAWSVRGVVLMHDYESTVPKLRVFYEDRSVQNVCIVKLIIWNSGSRAILAGDVDDRPEYQLRVEADKDVQILEIAPIETNSEPSRFRSELSLDGHQAAVSFHDIESKRGAVFQIIHSGRSPTDVQLTGRLVSVPIKFILPTELWDLVGRPDLARHRIPHLGRATDILLLAQFVLLLVLWLSEGIVGGFMALILACLTVVAASLYLYVKLWSNEQFSLRRRLPKGLGSFFETL